MFVCVCVRACTCVCVCVCVCLICADSTCLLFIQSVILVQGYLSTCPLPAQDARRWRYQWIELVVYLVSTGGTQQMARQRLDIQTKLMGEWGAGEARQKSKGEGNERWTIRSRKGLKRDRCKCGGKQNGEGGSTRKQEGNRARFTAKTLKSHKTLKWKKTDTTKPRLEDGARTGAQQPPTLDRRASKNKNTSCMRRGSGLLKVIRFI